MSRTIRRPSYGWWGGQERAYTTDKWAGWHRAPKWYRQSFKRRDRRHERTALHLGDWDRPSSLLRPRHYADWLWL